MPGRAYWPTTKRDWKRSSNPKRVPMTPSLAEKLPEGKWLVPCTPERVPIVLMPHDGVLLVDGIKNSVTAILPVWRDNGDDKALLEACQRYADYLVKHSSRGNLLSKVCLCPIENKTSLPTGGKYFINGLFPTHEQEMLAAAHVIKMRLTNIVRINLRHGLGLGGVDLERMIRVYCS